MKIKDITKISVIVFIIGILVYDVYAYYQGGQEATVSHLVITDWSRNYPAFTFMVGFVMGHLFWALKPNIKDYIKYLESKGYSVLKN